MLALDESTGTQIVNEQFPKLASRLQNELGRTRSEGSVSGLRPAESKLADRKLILHVGQRIREFELVEHLGQGGMGTVWKAFQSDPVKRDVAIKFVRAWVTSPSMLARFKNEQQSLAILKHPNIAQIFDAGVTEEGHPFCVMELADGPNLVEHASVLDFDVGERVKLFLTVCRAIQHAHQNGIIHRDLKPSNILVANDGNKFRAKVIDFGLAKVVRPESDSDLFQSSPTVVGQVLGTPDYMSPEQTSLGSSSSMSEVDTRADVYSLGAILYELLTGSKTFAEHRLHEITLEEAVEVIRHQDPMPFRKRKSEGTTLALVSRELEWITMKCLEKNRDRRYDTVAQLADDLQRFLDGEPVEAAPPSQLYRLSKFLSKNKVLTTYLLAVTLGLGLVTAMAGLVLSKNRELAGVNAQVVEARDKTELAKTNAESVTRYLSSVFQEASSTRSGKELKVVDALSEAVTNLDEDFPEDNETKASVQYAIGKTFLGLGQAELAFPLLERSREIRQRKLRPEDPKHFEVTYALAEAAYYLEKKPFIIDILSQEMMQFVESGKDNSFEFYKTKCLLSVVRSLGREFEYVDVAIDAAERMAELRSWEDEDVLSAQVYVSDCIHKTDNREMTTKFLRAAVERLEKVYPSRHVSILKVKDNLGQHLSTAVEKQTRLEAIAILEELFRDTRETLGDKDQSFMEAGNSAGFACYRGGAFEQGRQIYEELYETMLKSAETDNPMWVYAENNYGESLIKTFYFQKALLLLKVNRERRKNSYPPDDARVYVAAKDLALAELRLGKIETATVRIEEVLRAINDPEYQTHLSPSTMNRFRRQVEWVLGECMRVSGDLELAAKILEENVSHDADTPSAVPPHRWLSLGKTLVHLGRTDEGFAAFDTGIAVARETQVSNEFRLHLQREKAGAFLFVGNQDEAELLLKETVKEYEAAIESQQLPPDFLPYLLCRLQQKMLAKNSKAEADKTTTSELVSTLTKAMGKDSPLLLEVLSGLN
ncbi:serine/threonine-protein kinase [Mariniblastus fucicola]|nr:serine/threonine-protein kinase [Mariniblastus fucicola]